MTSTIQGVDTFRSDEQGVVASGKFTIIVSGARDADAALEVVKDLLKPEISDSLLRKAESNSLLSLTSNGEHVLTSYICCNYTTGTYSWCPGDASQSQQICSVMGTGCPA